FEINGHVFTCVMSACISNHKYDMVLPMFKRMLECRDTQVGSYPDVKSFETVLLGLLKGKFIAEGVEILKMAFGMPSNLGQTVDPIGDRIDRGLLQSWLEALRRRRMTNEIVS